MNGLCVAGWAWIVAFPTGSIGKKRWSGFAKHLRTPIAERLWHLADGMRLGHDQ